MAQEPSLSYCARELRRHDHDRYLTCLFAPAARREALFALHAFNLEVAKTAEVVSEPMLGRIRLQWWREALDEIYAGRPRRHEVIAPLAEAVRRHDLERAGFDRLIDGREFDLDGEPPESLERLEAYAADTSASLVFLALQVLGAADEDARTAGNHVGVAWALTGLIRAVPFHARQKRVYLPRALTEGAELDFGELFELRGTPALAQVVEQIAQRARQHLGKARALRSKVTARALPALLPAKLADRYLRILHRVGYDPFRPEVQEAPPARAWRLAVAFLVRRY